MRTDIPFGARVIVEDEAGYYHAYFVGGKNSEEKNFNLIALNRDTEIGDSYANILKVFFDPENANHYVLDNYQETDQRFPSSDFCFRSYFDKEITFKPQFSMDELISVISKDIK